MALAQYAFLWSSWSNMHGFDCLLAGLRTACMECTMRHRPPNPGAVCTQGKEAALQTLLDAHGQASSLEPNTRTCGMATYYGFDGYIK